MTIRVESELTRLRRVLVHRPGYEIDWMVPSMMERLLFDDILDGELARREHDAFTKLLQVAGAETVDPQELLVETMADDGARSTVLAALAREYGVKDEVIRQLAELPADALATALVTGVRDTSATSPEDEQHSYHLPPVPNYFFQRDPQVVIGDRVILSRMATEARERESLLAQTVFASHPRLAGWADLVPLRSSADAIHRPELEGGDVLVPSPEVLLVGLSERTNSRGVEALAAYLRREETTFRHLLVVELPNRRSYMHLDTVFTFIDEGLCLAYLPVIDPDGAERGHVYCVDLGARELTYTSCDSLPRALADRGLEVELVPCGGRDPIDQQREQWTDGANAFALAPGVITLYRRNHRTTEALERRGFRVVEEEAVIRGEVELLGQGPTVVTLLCHELARARGGPRCMTMPLLRQA